jgi:hypothetical protein
LFLAGIRGRAAHTLEKAFLPRVRALLAGASVILRPAGRSGFTGRGVEDHSWPGGGPYARHLRSLSATGTAKLALTGLPGNGLVSSRRRSSSRR